MKKLILIMTLAAVTLSSCLKDSATTVNFAKAGNIVNFPLSGLANFGSDALTADTSVVQFAVSYATVNPNPAVSVTIAVDNTMVTSYDAANPAINYVTMPTSAYTLSATTLNIPAGGQYVFTTLTVYKNTLDPTVSYMLPIKIVSATAGIISANQSVHYFHIIGNDFAGAYLHDYTRIPAAGNYVGQPATLLPDNPNQLEVAGGYYTGTIRYVITFTKNGSGASATYTNFGVILNPDDVANILVANGLSVASPPKFVGNDPTATYTYAQVTHGLFKFNWITGSGRNITDYYYKP